MSAAVEAAIRAKTDPGKALDEAFPELAANSGSVFSSLPPEMLELIDFEEPREDGAVYTDHSLEEFTSKHQETDEEDEPDEK